MRQSLAEVKAITPDDTLVDANDEASSDTLTECLGELKAKKLARHELSDRPVTSFNAGRNAAKG